MQINFFEEFPTAENIAKLKTIAWNSTIYLAVESLEQFQNLAQKYRKKNITFAYWPVLKKEEGYWLSPFSKPEALQRIIKEIKEAKRIPFIMWDAELPFRHPKLFFRIDHFFVNRLRIKRFLRKYGEIMATSEYPLKSKLAEFFLIRLGVSFSPRKYGNKKIVMYYSSMHKEAGRFLLGNIKRLHDKYGNKLSVALGTIAPGILGREPILSPQDLKRDLQLMQDIGIEEIVIFRLGGLNKEYVKVLKEFVDDNRDGADLIIKKSKIGQFSKGVFAKRDFKKGEAVIQYNLTPLTEKEYQQLPEEEKQFTHKQRGAIYLYSVPERYVNHSPKPNTIQNLKKKCDVALKDIKKGEEITTDATKDDVY